jgi:hypothetical protein
MRREYKVNKYWFSWGYGKRFALGFSIDKYSINVDFLFIWAGIER